MSLANLALTNTFLDQLVRLNQLVVVVNSLTDGQANLSGTILITNANHLRSNVSLEVANGMIKGDGALLSNISVTSLTSNTININSGTPQLTVQNNIVQLGKTVTLNLVVATGLSDNSANLATGSLVNTVSQVAKSAADTSNTALGFAQSAFAFANSGGQSQLTAQGAFTQANTATLAAAGALSEAIGAFAEANAAFTLATSANTLAGSANTNAIIGQTIAIAAFLAANNAGNNAINASSVTIGTTPIARLPVANGNAFRANTASLLLDTDGIWGSAGLVTLSYASTLSIDMGSFFNANVKLTGNTTLGQPSNTKIGQSGYIVLEQDATGGRTVAYHVDFKFTGNSRPTATTTASGIDVLYYTVLKPNFIHASLNKNVA